MSVGEIITIATFVHIAELGLFAIYWFDLDGRDGFVFFNPVKNYKAWSSMNWFGAGFFTLLLNVICPFWAFCYWFCKLCTVGRKQ